MTNPNTCNTDVFLLMDDAVTVAVLMCCVVLLPQVLLAIGRDPTTKPLALDKAGVQTAG